MSGQKLSLLNRGASFIDLRQILSDKQLVLSFLTHVKILMHTGIVEQKGIISFFRVTRVGVDEALVS